MFDDGRIIRDRVEGKHMSEQPKEANVIVPLEAVHCAGRLVGELNIG